MRGGKLDTQADNTANQRAPFLHNLVFLLSLFLMYRRAL
jgi:hypothetical protein